MAKSKAVVTPVGKIKWLPDVAEHDYASAEAYLSLKLDAAQVSKAIGRLRKAEITVRRANDILRASGLTAAPLDDPGVIKDIVKVIEGKRLSPVLVVAGAGGPTSPTASIACRSCTGSIPTARCRCGWDERPEHYRAKYTVTRTGTPATLAFWAFVVICLKRWLCSSA